MKKIKIITWNLHFGGDHEEKLKYLFDKANPDIALLQECKLSIKNSPVLNGKKIYMAGKAKGLSEQNKAPWGTALVVDNSLKSEDITYEYFPEEEKQKTGKVIVIRVFFENEFIDFCSLHTDSETTTRTVQHLREIFNEKIKKSSNLIIGGDLNAAANITYSKKFFDELKSSNLENCIPEYPQTFFDGQMEYHYQCDHIFASKDLFPRIEKLNAEYDNSDIKPFASKTWNYGKVKKFSDHTIVEINLNLI